MAESKKFPQTCISVHDENLLTKVAVSCLAHTVRKSKRKVFHYWWARNSKASHRQSFAKVQHEISPSFFFPSCRRSSHSKGRLRLTSAAATFRTALPCSVGSRHRVQRPASLPPSRQKMSFMWETPSRFSFILRLTSTWLGPGSRASVFPPLLPMYVGEASARLLEKDEIFFFNLVLQPPGQARFRSRSGRTLRHPTCFGCFLHSIFSFDLSA